MAANARAWSAPTFAVFKKSIMKNLARRLAKYPVTIINSFDKLQKFAQIRLILFPIRALFHPNTEQRDSLNPKTANQQRLNFSD
ncbi:MAG: hypothetical protein H6562_13390 [Lewinellaceae bacterium]|nr:hypothetical protein [Lewinella sp.]MCB9279879.1 hypothetical protein [Lewinellaceae bacterium]